MEVPVIAEDKFIDDAYHGEPIWSKALTMKNKALKNGGRYFFLHRKNLVKSHSGKLGVI